MSYEANEQPFAWRWVLLSMGIFIGAELILGGLVGHIALGNAFSYSLRFTLQGLLNLVSYLIGGFVIGVISPRIRIWEPAVGAFLSVALMLSMSFFTPYSFIRFSTNKMLIGGLIAFFLALTGAKAGERVTGQM